VIVLEARDRIGGRVFTVRDARLAAPVELGAEFVHGEAPLLRALLAEAGLTAYDIGGDHRTARGGRLSATAPWDAIDRVLARIPARGADLSCAAFFAGLRGRVPAREIREARRFVESFHGADAADLSARSIAPGPGERASEAALHSARVLGGYDQVPGFLARGLGAELRLRAPVATIEWRRGRVELSLRSGARRPSRVSARAAVVTVPVGVLAAPPRGLPGLRLDPDPPARRRAIQSVAMGTVTRLAIAFRTAPWSLNGSDDHHGDRLGKLSFLHMPRGDFNVWWTAYPLESPLAIAWSGGPRGAACDHALDDSGKRAVRSRAIAELAAALDVAPRAVSSRIEASWIHDWQHDPWSRGAYSYARVGGAGAARALSRPIEATLFFAGEATDVGGGTGTVEGALASGQRAARQVARALGR
jgi:monoamine oxidase